MAKKLRKFRRYRNYNYQGEQHFDIFHTRYCVSIIRKKGETCAFEKRNNILFQTRRFYNRLNVEIVEMIVFVVTRISFLRRGGELIFYHVALSFRILFNTYFSSPSK